MNYYLGVYYIDKCTQALRLIKAENETKALEKLCAYAMGKGFSREGAKIIETIE